MKKYLPLFLSLGISFGFAYLGSAVTMPSIDTWYLTLNKPSFNPPNWIFGPVWALLYFLMGTSSFLVWNKLKKIKTPLKIYGFQLVLNFLWSYLFFGLHRPNLAFFEIIFLWLFILLTIKSFYRVEKVSAYLLIPYIFWVSFACVLNYSIVTLN